MSLLIALLIFQGFARSWFLAHWFAPPVGTPHIGLLLMFHGTVFSSWLALSVVQPLLIASRNYRLHRTLGWAGAGLLVLMYIAGNLAAIAAMHAGFIGMGDRYAAYALPFFDMHTFGLLAGLAILQRKNPEAHKRLILLAATQLLEPGLARTPLDWFQTGFPYASVFGCDFVILAGASYDYLTRGKVHPVWLWGGTIVLASEILRVSVWHTGPWLAFAHGMATLYVP